MKKFILIILCFILIGCTSNKEEPIIEEPEETFDVEYISDGCSIFDIDYETNTVTLNYANRDERYEYHFISFDGTHKIDEIIDDDTYTYNFTHGGSMVLDFGIKVAEIDKFNTLYKNIAKCKTYFYKDFECGDIIVTEGNSIRIEVYDDKTYYLAIGDDNDNWIFTDSFKNYFDFNIFEAGNYQIDVNVEKYDKQGNNQSYTLKTYYLQIDKSIELPANSNSQVSSSTNTNSVTISENPESYAHIINHGNGVFTLEAVKSDDYVIMYGLKDNYSFGDFNTNYKFALQKPGKYDVILCKKIDDNSFYDLATYSINVTDVLNEIDFYLLSYDINGLNYDKNTECVKKAHELTDHLANDYDKAEAIWKYIKSNFTYDFVNSDTNYTFLASETADDTFKRKSGICGNFARLFAVMARSIGIPTRYVAGEMRNPNEKFTGECNHAWNEIYIDGSWHSVDVTNDLDSSDSTNTHMYHDITDIETNYRVMDYD